jgi:hypothetical protein
MKKVKDHKWDIRWYRIGIFVAVLSVVLNVNTLVFKSAYLIRGELVGDQLELALLFATFFHSLIAVGQGYLLVYFHKWIKELKDG